MVPAAQAKGSGQLVRQKVDLGLGCSGACQGVEPVVFQIGTLPLYLPCCCLLQKESDMVRIPVLCPRCHTDQVMKGGKTKVHI